MNQSHADNLLHTLQAQCPLISWSVNVSELVKENLVVVSTIGINGIVFGNTRFVSHNEMLNHRERLPRIIVEDVVRDLVKAVVEWRPKGERGI